MGAHQVVVGVDGSPGSFRALDFAAAEAVRRRAPLEIVHCVPDPGTAAPVLAAAAGRVRERHPGLAVFATAATGDPAAVLAARGRGAELTVVGHRTLGPLAARLLRSVSRRLAARARGPVLVVPGGRGEPAGEPVGTAGGGQAGRADAAGGDEHAVVLGLESDDDAEPALYAFADADRRGVPLRVLHTGGYRSPAGPGTPPDTAAVPPRPTGPPTPPDGTPRAGEARPGTTRRLLGAVLPGRADEPDGGGRDVGAPPSRGRRAGAHEGDPRYATLPALIESTRHADVLVVPVRPRAGGPGHRLPAAEAALIRHAHCPVVLVPVPIRRHGRRTDR